MIESYKKNSDGDVVITKLVDKLLKEIAISSNGIYINGLNTELVVNEIVDKLKEINKEIENMIKQLQKNGKSSCKS